MKLEIKSDGMVFNLRFLLLKHHDQKKLWEEFVSSYNSKVRENH